MTPRVSRLPFWLIGLVLALGAPLDAQRLGRDVFPVHYALHLTPDLEAGSFAGRATIDVSIQRPTSEIVLHAAELEIDSVIVVSGESRHQASVRYDRATETVALVTDGVVPPGRASLELVYRGTLNDDLRGFYRGSSSGGAYASTQLEATDARRAFPCFDEPAFRATFDISLTVDRRHEVFSNGPVRSTAADPDGVTKTVRFETTPRLPTYLVAFTVGDFSCLEGEASDVPIRVCADPERVELGRYALDAAEWLLPFFEEYFGIPYPFAKLDNIGVADFEAGAMENAGAILYRETGLLVDPDSSSLAERQRVAVVVAHEIAHQWFGNLVTIDWWDDLWLKEGFANFMEMESLGVWKPSWEPVVEAAGAAGWPLGSDTLAGARAIRARAETPEEINSMFDGIAYGKASVVLGMIQRYLGDEAMRAGIHRYLTRHAYGSASAADFFGALGETAERPVVPVMESFVSQPGIPRIRVGEPQCEEGETKVLLTQDRFFVAGSLLGTTPEQVWQIPVCPAGGECRLFDRPEQEVRFSGCEAPLFLNREGRGYYVTHYGKEHLGRLRSGLFESLGAADRLILVRDEWLLVRAGERSIVDYVELLEALTGETEPLVYDQFLGTLESMDERLVTDSDRPRFQAWVRHLLGPVAETIGWNRREGEAERRSVLRRELVDTLGRVAADPRLIEPARRTVESYLGGQPVDPNLIRSALTLAAIHGDGELYDRYLARMREAQTPQEYNLMLGVLGSFRAPELIRRTLDLALSEEIRSQDFSRILGGLRSNPRAEDPSWDTLRTRWDEYMAKIPRQNHPFVLPFVARGICDEDRWTELEEFAADKDYNEVEMDRAEEVARNCLEFRRRHQGDLAAWLAER